MNVYFRKNLKLAKLTKLHKRLNNLASKKNSAGTRRQLICFHRYCHQLKLAGVASLFSLPVIPSANLLSAQCIPDGAEFHVNTYTLEDQFNPSIAMAHNGYFVITWQSGNNTGTMDDQDGSQYGIYAQRFNFAGTPTGSEFQVNEQTMDWQANPDIAMDKDGNFVIAWDDRIQDNGTWGIYARRYNAMGVALEISEFRVNSYTTGTQDEPSVAMDRDGNFVIAWRSVGQDAGTIGIYAQRYNSNGLAEGSEFRANSYTTGNQAYPDVAMDKYGNFVIVWTSFGQDGSSGGIYARLYDSDGIAQGNDFQVNSYTTGNQDEVAVAMNDSGKFVITWRSNLQDGSEYGVYAQRFNASGMKMGGEFHVNTFTNFDQEFSDVAMDEYGGFVITWEDRTLDGDIHGVFAQQYSPLGLPIGSNFLVNTETSSSQGTPAIAMDGDKKFAITWRSFEQNDDQNGVFAQLYSCPSPIPTVSQWGLIILGLLFVILNIVYERERTKIKRKNHI